MITADSVDGPASTRRYEGIRHLHGPRNAHRDGFTLVELLVVVAVIGLLVVLLLPALNAARESARRTQCGNRLKQIGLGVISHESTHRRLPVGAITRGPCCETKSFTNWAIEILPFIEEQVLYARYDQTRANEDPQNREVVRSRVETYLCPSDASVTKKPLARPQTGPGSSTVFHRGSYRAMTGRADGDLPWDGMHDRTVRAWPLRERWMGMFPTQGYHELIHPIQSRDVTDGLSHTIMVGEAYTTTDVPGKETRNTLWAYSYTSYNKSHLVPESRYLLGDYLRCNEIGNRIGGANCKRFWGSQHANVIQFVFGDCSVRPVSLDVDVFVLAEAATIAGGEEGPRFD